MITRLFSAILCVAWFTSCSSNDDQTAKVQVNAESPGRALVLDSIAAHGGSEAWYSSGALQFRWKYFMEDLGAEAIVDTLQVVDPKSFDVRHEVAGSNVTFGMKNGEHWIHPKGATFTPPAQFWSLTPIYFVGIPFVFNDPGASFELLDEPMDFAGESFTQVKITYGKDSGESPDDYYVLLIDPKTKITKGAYYTVTHKLVAPNGAGPAKFITLDDLKEYNGVLLAGSHRTFSMKDGKIADRMRRTEVSEIKWLPRGSVSFSKPE